MGKWEELCCPSLVATLDLIHERVEEEEALNSSRAQRYCGSTRYSQTEVQGSPQHMGPQCIISQFIYLKNCFILAVHWWQGQILVTLHTFIRISAVL